jgi:hypothetical protein
MAKLPSNSGGFCEVAASTHSCPSPIIPSGHSQRYVPSRLKQIACAPHLANPSWHSSTSPQYPSETAVNPVAHLQIPFTHSPLTHFKHLLVGEIGVEDEEKGKMDVDDGIVMDCAIGVVVFGGRTHLWPSPWNGGRQWHS